MLGKIKKSLSNLSKLSGGVYSDEEPKSETSKPKSEPKAEPKLESGSEPAILASVSLTKIEIEMGPFQADQQVNGDAAAASDSPSNEKAAEKKPVAAPAAAEGKDGEPAKKKKPVKKTIPAWASIDDAKKKKGEAAAAPSSSLAVIEEALVKCGDNKGRASSAAIRNFVKKNYPQWPKHVFKLAMKRAIAQDRISLVRGHGLAGTFKKGKNFKAPKDAKNKKGASGSKPLVPLEDLFPNAFCWIAHPKESSFNYIKKYIAKHYKDLGDVEGKPLWNAIEAALKRGQLKRVTGAGKSGTFSLVDGAKKSGGKYEDAIEDAIIANNAPKDASVSKLRDYLGEYHKEYETDMKPKVLLKALERAEAAGHIERISGTGGFSGSFMLSYPYYPSPKELWGKWYEDPNKASTSTPKKKKGKKAESSDEESSSEEEDSSEEEESSDEDDEPVYVPRKKKRGPPAARKTLITPKKRKPAAKAKAGGRRK